jgi:hypothetical protein
VAVPRRSANGRAPSGVAVLPDRTAAGAAERSAA